MTAAARSPRGQCRPRAALRRPPRERCRPPRSVAECYPVLNVTLTHSIPDTTALTSSIHAARAAIGRASRPGWAVLPLRPFITPGSRPRRRRCAGSRGPPGSRVSSPRPAGGLDLGWPSASPSGRSGLVARLGRAAFLPEPAPARGGAPGGRRTRDRPAFPRLSCWGCLRALSRIPSAGSASPSRRLGLCRFLERMLENEAVERARGEGEERKRLHRKRPPTRDPSFKAQYFYFLPTI